MKNYFGFDPYAYDFWPIYEAIKTYYPIGVRFENFIYREYEGQKKFGALLVDNTHNQENFKERCLNFTNQLQEQLGLEIDGTTLGQQPSFSFDVIIERSEEPGFVRLKKLCVAISLLGDFYAIYGIDESFMIDEGERYPRHYHAVHAITTSPYKEFEQPFLAVKKAIQDRYPTHRQVPFYMLTMYMEGLYDRYDEKSECMIYNALFDQKLKHYEHFQFRGTQDFGESEWIKEGVDPTEIRTVEVVVMPPPPIQPPANLQ